MIPFNKPYITSKEFDYIRQTVSLGKLSANGTFTLRCEQVMQDRCHTERCFLTTSCSSALEMAAMVCDIRLGDEVIVPSYTFVSTAMAFVRSGAVIRFIDSLPHHPNMNAQQVEELITPRTRAIVPVHYNGVSCNMEALGALAQKYGLYIIEDAAHCTLNPISPYAGISCFSFHETKNIHCGEGGAMTINDPTLLEKAEKVWLKGTNRKAFEQGKVSNYEWVSEGASFAPSEINAAFLYAQLESLEDIQQRRAHLWNLYRTLLSPLAEDGCFLFPAHQGSSHIMYITCRSKRERDALATRLFSKGVTAVSHYQGLHRSPYGSRFHDGSLLPHAEMFTDCLLRLPLFYELTEEQVKYITACLGSFYLQMSIK